MLFRTEQIVTLALAAVLVCSSGVALSYPGMQPKTDDKKKLQLKLPLKKPIIAPTSKSAVSCRVFHISRKELTSEATCKGVRLTVHKGKSAKPLGILKQAAFQNSSCQFQVTHKKGQTYICHYDHQGVTYTTARAKRPGTRPLLLVVTDLTEDSSSLWLSRVVVLYELAEGSRSFSGQIQAFFNLENPTNKTIDCRKKPWPIPILVPAVFAEYGLADMLRLHKSKRIVVKSSTNDADVVLTKQGYVFKGVIRPGKQARLFQMLSPLTQYSHELELRLTGAPKIGRVSVLMNHSSMFRPRLSVNGVESTAIQTNRGIKFFESGLNSIPAGKAVVIRFGHLPVPSNSGAQIAFYLLIAMALATFIFLTIHLGRIPLPAFVQRRLRRLLKGYLLD